MRAVDDLAVETFDQQGIYTVQSRLCLALGVDEKITKRAGHGRRRRYVTVLVNLATSRPLDIVEGRAKPVLKAWLAVQTSTWRDAVRIVALDPAASYRAALTDPQVGLHHAAGLGGQYQRVKVYVWDRRPQIWAEFAIMAADTLGRSRT